MLIPSAATSRWAIPMNDVTAEKADGCEVVYTTMKVSDDVAVILPPKTQIAPDGTVTLPTAAGAEVTTAVATVIDLPADTKIAQDGTVTLPPNKTADVKINSAAITLPNNTRINAYTGAIALASNAELTTGANTTIALPAGTSIAADGAITLPPNAPAARMMTASGAGQAARTTRTKN